MAMSEENKLFMQCRKVYGDDVIIVHRKDCAYHYTTSSLPPAETKSILSAILKRFG